MCYSSKFWAPSNICPPNNQRHVCSCCYIFSAFLCVCLCSKKSWDNDRHSRGYFFFLSFFLSFLSFVSSLFSHFFWAFSILSPTPRMKGGVSTLEVSISCTLRLVPSPTFALLGGGFSFTFPLSFSFALAAAVFRRLWFGFCWFGLCLRRRGSRPMCITITDEEEEEYELGCDVDFCWLSWLALLLSEVSCSGTSSAFFCHGLI